MQPTKAVVKTTFLRSPEDVKHATKLVITNSLTSGLHKRMGAKELHHV